MSDELFVTLMVVKSLKSAAAPEVTERIAGCVKVTAVNNRLEDLRAMGYLVRTRNGKSWLYSPTGKRAGGLALAPTQTAASMLQRIK